jgi:hypothetical protein
MERQEVQELLRRSDIFFDARGWLAMDAYARLGRDYILGR